MYLWWRYVKSQHLELDRLAVQNDRYKSYNGYRPRGRQTSNRNNEAEEEDDDDPAALMLMAPRSNSSSGLLSSHHRVSSLSTVTTAAITGSPNRVGRFRSGGGIDPRSVSNNGLFGRMHRSNEDDESDDEYNQ